MALISFLVKWSKRVCFFYFGYRAFWQKLNFGIISLTFDLPVQRRMKEKEEFPSGIFLFGATTYSVTISSYSKPSSGISSELYLYVNTYFI